MHHPVGGSDRLYAFVCAGGLFVISSFKRRLYKVFKICIDSRLITETIFPHIHKVVIVSLYYKIEGAFLND